MNVTFVIFLLAALLTSSSIALFYLHFVASIVSLAGSFYAFLESYDLGKSFINVVNACRMIEIGLKYDSAGLVWMSLLTGIRIGFNVFAGDSVFSVPVAIVIFVGVSATLEIVSYITGNTMNSHTTRFAIAASDNAHFRGVSVSDKISAVKLWLQSLLHITTASRIMDASQAVMAAEGWFRLTRFKFIVNALCIAFLTASVMPQHEVHQYTLSPENLDEYEDDA